MSLIKAIFSVLIAVSISGCATSPVSSVSETLPGAEPPRSLSPQQGDAQAKETNAAPDTARDQDTVRKVALTLTAVSDPESKSYKIGPRDVLEITVFQAPELSKTIQVSEAGTINFPLLGEVNAAGKSAREIEQDLRQRLGAKYLQNPQISVFVKDHFSQRITMEGALKKPGVYQIAGGMSLLQAIAEAQGFDDTASHTVLLFRQVNGRRLAAQYDVSAIREGGAEDPHLEAGDVVVVPTSNLKEGMNIMLKFVPLATLAPYL